MRILCVRCQRKLKCHKQGVDVVETFGRDSDKPYKIWKADLFRCPDCGFEVVAGFGSANYAEHYQPGFEKALRQALPPYWDKSC